MIPPKHPREAVRLAALHNYNILDTPPETAYDDITKLASYICQTPISVINLIDKERQWFKSEIGLGVRETPLDVSICAHSLLQPDLFVVPDTTLDARFACNPLVTGEPGLRFYAGALLETPEGYPIGTLCVLDYRPRELTPEQGEALQALARQVMAQMELHRHAAEVAELNAQLQRAMTESHHRIKNNLQAIAALAELQVNEAEGSVPSSALTRVAHHARALGVLHDLLTLNSQDGSDTARVSLRDALAQLAPHLEPFLPGRLAVNSDDISLPLKGASSFSLLVNELVSNAFKHGGQRVSVTLRAGAEEATLIVDDDGPGFPEGFDPVCAANVGLDLIHSLACHDLRGALTFDNRPNGGAHITVCFPLP